MECNGQLLKISENLALYSLIGNKFGGDGETTFAVPDLRGRVIVGQSEKLKTGMTGGEETLTNEGQLVELQSGTGAKLNSSVIKTQDNRQPYQVIGYYISVNGLVPNIKE